jgi:hypothetical protein
MTQRFDLQELAGPAYTHLISDRAVVTEDQLIDLATRILRNHGVPFTVFQRGEGNFLQSVLMGKAMAVHGLVILLALTVGTILAGIIGPVLSVPLTAVAWAVIKVWSGDDTPEDRKIVELDVAVTV